VAPRTRSNEPNEDPKRRIAKPIDLSSAVPRTRTMLEPEFVISYRGYMAETTALAARMLVDLAVKNGKGAAKPENLFLADPNGLDLTPGESPLGDIAAVPVVERGPSTVSCKWRGEQGRIDLQKLLLLFRFEIPAKHTAHIPVGVDNVEGLGRALIIRFTEARFAPIEVRRNTSKKSQAGSQGPTAGQAPDKTQSSPAAASDPVATPKTAPPGPHETGSGEIKAG